ncbi:hypothetical protein ACJMK2_016739 [Sinanodonta woodiana]|uniref:Coiled-coil domain-containing protein 51 n=1 Tax=Sinanodonta woodiana TaxID=1069815 RepID=A0ABD3UUM4_SINWO
MALAWRRFGCVCRRHCIFSWSQYVRSMAITGHAATDQALEKITGGRINRWLQSYEDFVGLTEVKEAQHSVTQAENTYRELQEQRRTMQQQLSSIQAKLKAISAEIEKTNRGTDSYIKLVTQENEIIKDEKIVINKLELFEEGEKQQFSVLSSALRESHEKERARAERMKYWGITGSVIGAVIGIVGTTVNNHMRMKELRQIVTTSAESSKDYRDVTMQLFDSLKEQNRKVEAFIGDVRETFGHQASRPVSDPKLLHPNELSPLTAKVDEVIVLVKTQQKHLDQEIRDVKKLLATGNIKRNEGSIVYVGPEVETMLKTTEQNLERKLKLHAIGTVTFIYAAVVVTIPIIMAIFGGGGN